MARERKEPGADERRRAQQAVDDAQKALDDARDRLAEEQGELRAIVTRDVPQFVVRPKPNVHIAHEGKNYYGAEYGVVEGAKGRMEHGEVSDEKEVILDGPTAMALVMDGKADIVRSVDA